MLTIFINRLKFEDFETLQYLGSGAFSTVEHVKVSERNA